MKLTLVIHGVDVSSTEVTPEAVGAMADDIGRLKLSDFDEVRHKVADLEEKLADALSKADVADYSRELAVTRCQELEARLAEVEALLPDDLMFADTGVVDPAALARRTRPQA